MPKISFQPYSNALPPIKLDGKIYVVMAGTYQRKKNEKVITARYTSDGGIDLQKQNTEKHRWSMTLAVPLSTSYVVLDDTTLTESDMGTIANLQTTEDKVGTSALIEYYDIDTDWDFSGTAGYVVYIDSMDFMQPNGNDMGLWQVPITLWGYDNPEMAAAAGMDLEGWSVFMAGGA